MSTIRLELTGKELFLLYQTLETCIKALDIKLESASTSENEYSVIQNDFITLKPMLSQLKEALSTKNNNDI